jgi:restriction system protein
VPEITRKRTGEILREIFGALVQQPDGALKASEVIATAASKLVLSEYERGFYPSGGQRFDKIARFGTLATVKAGWLIKQKGRWTLTEEGRAAYAAYPDPEAFFRQADQRYNEWARNRPEMQDAEVEPDEVVATPHAPAAAVRLEEAEESAWVEVEGFVLGMNPYDFQELVGALLRGLGYFVVWTAPPGKDGGVDLVAAPDPLGTRLPRIKVQVKRQQVAVTVDGLRSFMATLGSDDVGLFVATGGFTKDAREEARMQATRRVTLIDLERLFDLWVEHYPKLPDSDRRRLPLKPVYFLAPE